MYMEIIKKKGGFNPTPISKLFISIFLAFNLTATVNEVYSTITVFIISLFYALNSKLKTAIKSLLFYLIILFLIYNSNKVEIAFLQKYVFIFIVFIKIFFVPLFAGKFLVDTSDVSSMIVSLEKIKIPKVIIIPLAVVFRYFPAFREDKKSIKMAMKMRGITFKNPIKYLEYVSIPVLMSAISISDDISKAAETKCIADPCKKTRYTKIKFGLADIVYVTVIVLLNILGRIYA